MEVRGIVHRGTLPILILTTSWQSQEATQPKLLFWRFNCHESGLQEARLLFTWRLQLILTKGVCPKSSEKTALYVQGGKKGTDAKDLSQVPATAVWSNSDRVCVGMQGREEGRGKEASPRQAECGTSLSNPLPAHGQAKPAIAIRASSTTSLLDVKLWEIHIKFAI